MKKFDVYLQRAHVPEWKENYIDYVILKEELKRFGKRRRELQRGNLEWSDVLGTAGSDDNNLAFRYTLQGSSSGEEMVGTNNDRLSTLERDEFKRVLQEQLEKATRFFQASWIKFQSTSHAEEKDEEDEILELYGFAVVNICTLRQVILKFNAHSRMYNGTIFVSEYEVLNQPQASPHDIEGEESIDFSVQTVVPPLLTLMEPLQARVITMPSYWMMSDTPEALSMRQAGDKPLTNFRARVEELEALLEQTSWKQQTRQSPNRSERFLMTVRSFYLAGTANLGISMEPKFLHAQVRGFKKEMKAIAVWREKPLLIGFGIDDESATGTVIGEMDPANVWPLFLNLVGCFLFMMNNYIIEPSSAYYANALGSSDALSGIMMGMAPWFALVSAVGYSVWTNTSYKQPILFAGTLMVIGNTLYGAAYAHQSMSMCLVGRAICGFGAPRIINRRYVADATPFSLRTISSAAFALTTAVGAASGPGAAILLDLIPEFNFYLPFLGVQTFNGMTGPGFLMALLWFIFAVAIVVSFGEPTRSGLDELKQREALERKKESEASLIEDLYDDDDSVGSLSVGSYDRRCHAGSKHSPLYCIRHMTRATALCMALIFMKRIALESIVGSTSIVTKNRYAWSIRNVGTLHLVNGLIVIPVSIFAGWISQYREDRYLAMWFMGITALGMLIMIDVTDFVDTATYETYNYDSPYSVGQVQYIIGCLIAFSGVEACESFVASLMSKVVPSELASGTFNSGLLATLVGTGGVAVADVFITAMGLISIRNLLNSLILPGLFLMLLSMFLLWRNYSIVAV